MKRYLVTSLALALAFGLPGRASAFTETGNKDTVATTVTATLDDATDLLVQVVRQGSAIDALDILGFGNDIGQDDVTNAFVDFCATNMEANPEACEAAVEKSLSMVTSLNPHIGYEKASAIAKEAFKTGKTIRELCKEQNILPAETLDEALDPFRMTEPQA